MSWELIRKWWFLIVALIAAAGWAAKTDAQLIFHENIFVRIEKRLERIENKIDIIVKE